MMMQKIRHNRLFKLMAIRVVLVFFVTSTFQGISYADISMLATNPEIHGPDKDEVATHFILRAIESMKERNKEDQEIVEKLTPWVGGLEDIEFIDDVEGKEGVFKIGLPKKDKSLLIVYEEGVARIDTEEEGYDHYVHDVAQDPQLAKAEHISLDKLDDRLQTEGLKARVIEELEDIAAGFRRISPRLAERALELRTRRISGVTEEGVGFERTFLNFVDDIKGFDGHAGKTGIHIHKKYLKKGYRDKEGRNLRDIMEHEILAYYFPYKHKRINKIQARLKRWREIEGYSRTGLMFSSLWRDRDLHPDRIKVVEDRTDEDDRDWIWPGADSAEEREDEGMPRQLIADVILLVDMERIQRVMGEDRERIQRVIDDIFRAIECVDMAQGVIEEDEGLYVSTQKYGLLFDEGILRLEHLDVLRRGLERHIFYAGDRWRCDEAESNVTRLRNLLMVRDLWRRSRTEEDFDLGRELADASRGVPEDVLATLYFEGYIEEELSEPLRRTLGVGDEETGAQFAAFRSEVRNHLFRASTLIREYEEGLARGPRDSVIHGRISSLAELIIRGDEEVLAEAVRLINDVFQRADRAELSRLLYSIRDVCRDLLNRPERGSFHQLLGDLRGHNLTPPAVSLLTYEMMSYLLLHGDESSQIEFARHCQGYYALVASAAVIEMYQSRFGRRVVGAENLPQLIRENPQIAVPIAFHCLDTINQRSNPYVGAVRELHATLGAYINKIVAERTEGGLIDELAEALDAALPDEEAAVARQERRYAEHEDPGNPRAIDPVIERYATEEEYRDSVISLLAPDLADPNLIALQTEFNTAIDNCGPDVREMLEERLIPMLDFTGGDMQLIVVGDENELALFEGDLVWGHAGTYVTRFALPEQLETPEGRAEIIGGFFHEIRDRSSRARQIYNERGPANLEALEEEYESDSRAIETQVAQDGRITDRRLRDEFAGLQFDEHPQPMLRPYTSAEQRPDYIMDITEDVQAEYRKTERVLLRPGDMIVYRPGRGEKPSARVVENIEGDDVHLVDIYREDMSGYAEGSVGRETLMNNLITALRFRDTQQDYIVTDNIVCFPGVGPATLLSGNFADVRDSESIGGIEEDREGRLIKLGNAPAGCVAVNGVMDPSGRIVAFGNFGELGDKIEERLQRGALFEFTVVVKMIQDGNIEAPDYRVFLFSTYGRRIPGIAMQRMLLAVNEADRIYKQKKRAEARLEPDEARLIIAMVTALRGHIKDAVDILKGKGEPPPINKGIAIEYGQARHGYDMAEDIYSTQFWQRRRDLAKAFVADPEVDDELYERFFGRDSAMYSLALHKDDLAYVFAKIIEPEEGASPHEGSPASDLTYEYTRDAGDLRRGLERLNGVLEERGIRPVGLAGHIRGQFR